MRFFFPDSQDQVDPTFDFRTEERSIYRVRQRDDRYAHEVLRKRAYTGILVSKAIVDGTSEGAGKYSLPQRHRLYRLGVRAFFRLGDSRGPRLDTMGDCGAFSYVREEVPPYTPDDVIDFYEACRFDYGISIDHVIFGYANEQDVTEVDPALLKQWKRRRSLTLELAEKFLRRVKARSATFVPVGVAQGWSPSSYAESIRSLQKMGYQRIALGGMVPLKTYQVIDSLRAASRVRWKNTQFHLLGVTRYEQVQMFASFGVTSFDSTSPFRQAFKDDKDNYHTPTRAFTALRIPQVEANLKMKKLIQAGHISQKDAVRLEQRALDAVRRFDRGRLGVERTLEAVLEYEQLHDPETDRASVYREALEAVPWKRCGCGLCGQVGADIALFRGSERNKRRGFHNLHAFNLRLQRELRAPARGRTSVKARNHG